MMMTAQSKALGESCLYTLVLCHLVLHKSYLSAVSMATTPHIDGTGRIFHESCSQRMLPSWRSLAQYLLYVGKSSAFSNFFPSGSLGTGSQFYPSNESRVQNKQCNKVLKSRMAEKHSKQLRADPRGQHEPAAPIGAYTVGIGCMKAGNKMLLEEECSPLWYVLLTSMVSRPVGC